MRIKVMGYNLLYAFHDRQGRAMVFHPDRAAAAAEVIRAKAQGFLANG